MKHNPKALNLLPSVLFREKRLGPVVQSGMNAAFAMRKSWVQIPPGPLKLLRKPALISAILVMVLCWRVLLAVLGIFSRFNEGLVFQSIVFGADNDEFSVNVACDVEKYRKLLGVGL